MDTILKFRTILWVGIISLFLSSIPIIVYWNQFKSLPLSDKPGDWSTFGDYVGGISGTLLSFLAVLFSLTSLYFTAIISKKIQENEFKFNEDQARKQLDALY